MEVRQRGQERGEGRRRTALGSNMPMAFRQLGASGRLAGVWEGERARATERAGGRRRKRAREPDEGGAGGEEEHGSRARRRVTERVPGCVVAGCRVCSKGPGGRQ